MNPVAEGTDPIFDFELQVARRADQLAQQSTMQGRNAFEIWCEAERETANPFSAHCDSAEFRRASK